MNTFCTIITGDYYAYALSLLESLKAHTASQVTLCVFVADNSAEEAFLENLEREHNGLNFIFHSEVHSLLAVQLFDKYHASYMDAYRWSMKPVFMNYLIEERGYEKVIYLDCDLFFYNNHGFLFDLLDHDAVLLSPHWRCADHPNVDFTNFKLNFQGGIYNGGFIGIHAKGTEMMSYWANLCLAACEINFESGFYVDQKYLDILHSRFEGVGILRHRGCNVASWNLTDNQRTLNEKGEVIINNRYPLIFIHFTSGTMRSIVSGYDPLLTPYFELYSNTINKYNPKINLLKKTHQQVEQLKIKETIHTPPISLIQKLRCQLRIRTRVNSFFSKKR